MARQPSLASSSSTIDQHDMHHNHHKQLSVSASQSQLQYCHWHKVPTYTRILYRCQRVCTRRRESWHKHNNTTTTPGLVFGRWWLSHWLPIKLAIHRPSTFCWADANPIRAFPLEASLSLALPFPIPRRPTHPVRAARAPSRVWMLPSMTHCQTPGHKPSSDKAGHLHISD